MSSNAPKPGLSKTQTLLKGVTTLRRARTRVFAFFTLLILTAVFSASALTANTDRPIAQQAGSFAANIFTFFSDFSSPKTGTSVADQNLNAKDDKLAPEVCVAPPANMVAWYPGQVNTNDIIGNPPNNGTGQGSLGYTAGKVGNAFNLNGSSNVQIPASAGLNVGASDGISVDAWINPSNTNQAPIVEWNNGTGAGLLNGIGVHFWTSFPAAGQLYVNVVDTAGNSHTFSTTSSPVTAIGNYQHVAFTYNKASGAVAIYHNGVAQPLTAANIGTGFTPQTSYDVYLGRRPAPGPSVYFTGGLDEVEIFNRDLTGAEVSSIVAAGSDGKCHQSTIQFDAATHSVSEAAGSYTFTLTRIGANDTAASVDFSTANGTATGGTSCTAGVDFVFTTTPSVGFAPGERTQNVTATICEDIVHEGNETFIGSITNPTGTGVSLGTPSTDTVTINDNDTVPNITINNSSVVEGNSGTVNMVFTVTKTGQTTFSSSATATPTNGTATGGAACTTGIDFINTPITVTFPASTTSPQTQTINVPVCGDFDVEGDETFTVVLAPVGGTSTTGAAGTGTILGDDSTVQFTSATFTQLEGTGGTSTASLTVSRTGSGTALPAATVDASTIQVGGTAVGNNSCSIAGTDYVVVSGQTLSWGAGDSSTKTLSVSICTDSVDELNETFNAQLSNAINTRIGTQSTAVVTITDDDNPPSFALTPSTTTVAEGAAATYTVTRSGNETALSTTVTWAATSGTATATTDFSPITGTVTFAAGTGGTQTFTINALTDSLFEGNENFTVALTAATNGSPFSGTNTTTITDTNTAPTFSINDVSQVEGNSGSTAFIFTITRTGDAQSPQTVTFNTSDGGGAFPATAPSDYTAIPSDTVTFTQGQATRQVAVIVNGDTIFENDETFSVNLVSANFGTFTRNRGLGTIVNDDAAPVFSFTATAGSPNETVVEGNSGTTPARFTITKTGATELSSTVTVNTVDGTATAGSDYVALVNAAVATFAPGDTVKTFDVTVNGDTIFENTETFTVNLSNVTNGTFGPPTSATGTITNDDNAPVLTISSTTPTVTEGGTTVWTITRSFVGPTTGTALTASALCTGSVTSGNSTIHAQSGDFSTGSQTISFAPADPNTMTCNIATTQDSVFEGAETFTVTLNTPSNATVAGGPFTGTINNDDACTFTVSNVSLPEGNAGTTPFIFTVTKGCNTGSSTATFGYSNTDGTATAPSDYTQILPGTLLYQPSETTKPLTVLVNGDLLVEPDETFNVNALNATVNGVPVPNGACGAATCALVSGVGTIVNDDGVPVNISGNIKQFVSGGPNTNLAGVTVTLSGSATLATVTDANGNYSFTALPSGGNYLITPTFTGKTLSPTSRSYSNVNANITNADFVAYNNGAVPRNLRVVNGFAPGSPAGTIMIPINLTAQGDEAALSFSLTYNAAILSNPVVTCGTASGVGCTLVANTGTPGQIGISVEPVGGGVYAAGDREIVKITFNTAATAASNTPINFSDVPSIRRTSDSSGNPLPTTYTDGFGVFGQGLEGDVESRFTGDGALLSNDVVTTRAFVAGIITPNPNFNEKQRADTSPAATKGDGNLDATDVVQTRRYVAGLDAPQTVGGPFAIANPVFEEMLSKSAAKSTEASVGRIIRVVSTAGTAGQNVVVQLQIDSQGNETAASFTVNFNPAILSISSVSSPATNPNVALGNDVPAGTALTVNGNQAGSGRIGILIDSNNSFALGTRQIIRLTFLAAANAPNGSTPVTFGATPTPQSVSDAGGNLQATTYEGGVVSFGPTAAGVTVSGRVTTANGQGLRNAQVIITDSEGVRRTVTTSSFGFYTFDDVEAGGTYVIGVSSKRYRFSSRVLNVSDSLSDVDFVGQN